MSDLLLIVRFIHQSIVADTTLDLALESLWQIHSVGNRNDKQSAVLIARPFKQVVQKLLLWRDQSIQLVDEQQSDPTSYFFDILIGFFVALGIANLLLENWLFVSRFEKIIKEQGSTLRAYLVAENFFGHDRIDQMRILQGHGVDMHDVEFL